MEKVTFTPMMRFVLLGLLAALLMGGCVSKGDFDQYQASMNSRLKKQEAANRELREQLVQAEAELSSQIATKTEPVQNRQATAWAEISALKSQLAQIRGQLDALEQQSMKDSNFQSNATAEVRDMRSQLQAISMALENQLAVDLEQARKQTGDKAGQDVASGAASGAAVAAGNEAGAAGNATAAPTTVAAEQPKVETSQALYDSALRLFKNRKYAQAQRQWAKFEKQYSKDRLVPNAIFWQGECFYQMQDYPRAVVSYQKVIEKFKKSTKYRPALLKQGMAFFKMGNADAGRVILEDELIKKYPKSAEARRAQTYLKGK